MKFALFTLALPMFAGFCVTADPAPPKYSKLTLGTNSDFFVWELVITPNGKAPDVVSREQIVEMLPLSFLKEYAARDVLDRKAKIGFWGTAKRYAPVVMTVAGVALGSWPVIVAGGVSEVRQVISDGLDSRAPNPSEVKHDLLPDSGARLTSQGWDGVIVTGIVHGATKIERICSYDVEQPLRTQVSFEVHNPYCSEALCR